MPGGVEEQQESQRCWSEVNENERKRKGSLRAQGASKLGDCKERGFILSEVASPHRILSGRVI